MHTPKEHRKKLNNKTWKCLFIDFDKESKVYCLFEPNSQKVLLSKDVMLDESKVGYQYLVQNIVKQDIIFPVSTTTTNSPKKIIDSEIESTTKNLEVSHLSNLELDSPRPPSPLQGHDQL